MNKLTLDASDIRILNAIQNHGKLSKLALSEMVNLSPTSCWSRLTKLQKAGLIKGYYAEIDTSKVTDLTKVIVTISLKKHNKLDFKKFESYIDTIDEIVSCVATGGGFDYVITIISPSLAAFQNTMDQLIEVDIGIDRYITYFVTRDVKLTRPNLVKTLI